MDCKKTKRIIIKVGTSTLTHENGGLNIRRMETLVKLISDLKNAGYEVLLVTSGAVGIGATKLKFEEYPRRIEDRQAAAAVGQCELMGIYGRFFSTYGHLVAQILLTRDVMENELLKANAAATINNLLARGVVPIFNENDSISTAQIGEVFGDNDTLSAYVARLCQADLLIILSDIDGFYDSDPKENPKAQLIKKVEVLTEDIIKKAGGAGSARGTGGMATKLVAVQIAHEKNISVVIANGKDANILYDIMDGDFVGTLFCGGGLNE